MWDKSHYENKSQPLIMRSNGPWVTVWKVVWKIGVIGKPNLWWRVARISICDCFEILYLFIVFNSKWNNFYILKWMPGIWLRKEYILQTTLCLELVCKSTWELDGKTLKTGKSYLQYKRKLEYVDWMVIYQQFNWMVTRFTNGECRNEAVFISYVSGSNQVYCLITDR